MTAAKTLATTLLLTAAFLAGCQPPPADPPKAGGVKKDGHDDEDGHEHGPGPHGGKVIELGKYHGEFCLDPAKKEATVYVLDGRVKNAVPLAVETMLLSVKAPRLQVELKASPQAGDPKGKSSRFVGTHEEFGVARVLEGTVSFEAGGKPYLGDFKGTGREGLKEGKKE